MNAITQNPTHASNLYDVGAQVPELENLFANCSSALSAANSIFESSNLQALSLKSEILEAYTQLDPTNEFNSETRTNRLAHILFTTFLSATGVQTELNDYSFDSNPGILSTIGSGVSWLATPITSPLNYGLSFVWSNPEPINCDLGATDLDRAAFTVCEGAKAFLAEKKVNLLTSDCPDVLKSNVSVISPEVIANLGAFLVAAEKGDTKLSFSPTNARRNWDTSFKSTFCEKNIDNTFCTDETQSLTPNELLTSLQDRISTKVFEEMQQALNPINKDLEEDHDEL